MKQNDIRVGLVYICKVSGKEAKVQIVSESTNVRGRRCWMAKNLATGRIIRINSAQRLRGEILWR